MRLQRSPSSSSGPISFSPLSTNDSNVSSQYASARSYSTSTSKYGEHGQPMSALVGHYVHHARQSSSLASVDLHPNQELPRILEQDSYKHGRQLSNELLEAANKSQVPVARPVTYATQAYREYLQQSSGVNSAVTSVASSAISSRQSSRPTSGYTSQSTSGQSSRGASPVSKKEEHDTASHPHHRSSHHHHHHLHAQNQQAAATQYVEAQFPAAQLSTTTITQQVSTLSFGNMVMTQSDSLESLAGVSHSNPKPRARPNPHHFTFNEADIMKSFLRAAERDRARAEREERAREAQQRMEMEAEYERRKQQQREMAARELALAAHAQAINGDTYPRGTVGDEFSSDASSDDGHQPVRHQHRHRFPPPPVHFKFSSHDVNKSASKPSQRQNIGHWTTFPRSSTVMLPAEQLKEWIRTMIQEQQEKQQQIENDLAKKKQQSSAPNSPASSRKADLLSSFSGSTTSRTSVRSIAARRASLPSSVSLDGTAKVAGVVRKGHMRSITYTNDRLAKIVPVDKITFSKIEGEKTMEKTSLNDSLRRSSLPGHSRQNSSESRPGFERSNVLKPVKGVPLSGTVAMATAAAIDTAHRRAVALHNRHHATLPAAVRSSEVLGLNGSTVSAPGSTNHSPARLLSSHGRMVKSTTVSPTRTQPRQLTSTLISQQRSNSVIVTQHQQPHPPLGRKSSIGGSESKNSSANNSPVLPSKSLSAVDATWQAAYEKSCQEIGGGVVNQTQQKHANPLYKDVPSSGYGQRSTVRA